MIKFSAIDWCVQHNKLALFRCDKKILLIDF